MSDLERCPLPECGKPAELCEDNEYVRCSDHNCDMHFSDVPVSVWGRLPRVSDTVRKVDVFVVSDGTVWCVTSDEKQAIECDKSYSGGALLRNSGLSKWTVPIHSAEHPKCGGCGNEIDPNTCSCGNPINEHSRTEGNHHPSVPMGCTCYQDGKAE